MVYHRDRGAYYLEFALSLALLLVLIGGTLDVARYLNAYSGVKQGVETTLRCLTTTESDCNASSHTTPKTSRNFRYFEQSSHLLYPVASFSGRAEWLFAPDRSALIEIRTPREVVTSVPQFGFKGAGEILSNEGSISLLSRNFVELSGTDPRTPHFSLTPSRTFGSGVLELTGRDISREEVLLIPFSLPSSPILEEASSLGLFCGSIDSTLRGCKNPYGRSERILARSLREDREPVVLHVRGESTGTTRRTEAALTLELYEESASPGRLLRYQGRSYHLSKSLGGQRFSGPRRDASFIPRGAAYGGETSMLSSELIASAEEAGYQEFALHSSVSLKRETRYLLRISLAPHAALERAEEIRWTLSGVDLYVPTYEIKSTTILCDETASCLPGCTNKNLGIGKELGVSRGIAHSFSLRAGCFPSEDDARRSLLSTSGRGTTCGASVIRTDERCTSKDERTSCLPSNSGLSSSPTQSELSETCPGAKLLPTTSISYTTEQREVGPFTTTECSLEIPLGELRRHRDLRVVSVRALSSGKPLPYSDEISCALFERKSKDLSTCPSGTLFRGSSPLRRGWSTLLSEEAHERCDVPRSAKVTLDAPSVTELSLAENQRSSLPQDIAYVRTVIDGFSEVPHGPFAEETPPECWLQNRCTRQLVSTTLVTEAHAQGSATKTALARGLEAAKTFSPYLTSICNGERDQPGCVALAAEKVGTSYLVSASTKVPLFFASLFGQSEATIAIARTRFDEHSHHAP